MAEYKFNVTDKKRKALVLEIGKYLNLQCRYLGGHEHAYEIGAYKVTGDGTLIGETNMGLLTHLDTAGFSADGYDVIPTETEPEQNEATGVIDIPAVFPAGGDGSEAPVEKLMVAQPGIPEEPDGAVETDAQHIDFIDDMPGRRNDYYAEGPHESDCADVKNDMTIKYPLNGITEEVLTNIRRMTEAKAPLIKAALGVDELPVILAGDCVEFPWFKTEPGDGDAAYTYSQFISCLAETAKRKKRVTAQPTQTDNPRFSMRVWLISLGMTGEDYATARRLLLNNLEGDSGWRFGKPDKASAGSAVPKRKRGGCPDINGDILEQIEYIQKNGEANMLDIHEVGELAFGYGFFELNRLIKTDPRTYLTFILDGSHA